MSLHSIFKKTYEANFALLSSQIDFYLLYKMKTHSQKIKALVFDAFQNAHKNEVLKYSLMRFWIPLGDYPQQA